MKVKGIVPMLATVDIQATIEFYRTYLGFECRGAYPPENPCWVSLWNGKCEMAFSLIMEVTPFKEPFVTGTIYLYVENVDEIWKNLKDKVEIVYPIKNFDYGMREFGIRDCHGYILNIGQNIE